MLGKENRGTKFYINLSNGLELMDMLRDSKDVMFLRIQSTHCEQKQWGRILMELDNSFMMYLALGYTCVVMDAGCRASSSRALWQGIPWIRYALSRCWYGDGNRWAFVKGHCCSKYFNEEYKKLDKKVIRRLKYFKQFLFSDSVHIITIGAKAEHDGDVRFFRHMIEENLLGENNG